MIKTQIVLVFGAQNIFFITTVGVFSIKNSKVNSIFIGHVSNGVIFNFHLYDISKFWAISISESQSLLFGPRTDSFIGVC